MLTYFVFTLVAATLMTLTYLTSLFKIFLDLSVILVVCCLVGLVGQVQENLKKHCEMVKSRQWYHYLCENEIRKHFGLKTDLEPPYASKILYLGHFWAKNKGLQVQGNRERC